ncbi:MAG: 50S ribosomal protein L32 [Rickettsiaceae bacterium]
MAVPKSKISKSRRNMRRSHHALTDIHLVIDKDTGEHKLPHHASLGRYNNRQISKIKTENSQ